MADIGLAAAVDIAPGCIGAGWHTAAGEPVGVGPGCVGGEKAASVELAAVRAVAVELPAAWRAAQLGAAGFVGPVSAAMALARGGAWSTQGSALVIEGAVLIGPAGKTFVFSSVEAAQKWVELNTARPAREWALIATLAAAAAATAMQKKAAALEKVAARVVAAAARQADESKKAALLAEASFCLGKWAM